MKVIKEFPRYPHLMRTYTSYEDLGRVIYRSRSYVNNCLNGRRDFTRPEKIAILVDMGLDPNQENLDEIFGNRPEVSSCIA